MLFVVPFCKFDFQKLPYLCGILGFRTRGIGENRAKALSIVKSLRIRPRSRSENYPTFGRLVAPATLLLFRRISDNF